ncbi:hypothetical protein [Abyssogena phaseoliformis symbiont]|nr:hypothetical protein [Abyssogena phaseoliformis symbiont]
MLSLVLLVFMSLAGDVSMSDNIEYCSVDDKSMNMSAVEHLSE